MSAHLPKAGGVFVQSESEVAAINMVYGAAGCGVRVMTSSSSPGISLKQEGITYMCRCRASRCHREHDARRPGPWYHPARSERLLSGHPGRRQRRLPSRWSSPPPLQEAADYVQIAFDVADYYRNPVMVLADGLIGQMMEAIEWRPVPKRELPAKDWATTGTHGQRQPNVINSLYIDPNLCAVTTTIWPKYGHGGERNPLVRRRNIEGCEIVCGLRHPLPGSPGPPLASCAPRGMKVGLFRPITLWPFPEEALRKLSKADHVKAFLDVEMSSTGQMIDDVRLSVEGRKPIHYLGHAGGVMPTVEEMVEAAKKALKEGK